MPPSSFQVTALPAVSEQIRRISDHAKAIGYGPSFLEDLADVNRRLSTDPDEWGDPIYDYRTLGMTRFRGSTKFFFIHYSVHKLKRLTYVQSVETNPNGPLG